MAIKLCSLSKMHFFGLRAPLRAQANSQVFNFSRVTKPQTSPFRKTGAIQLLILPEEFTLFLQCSLPDAKHTVINRSFIKLFTKGKTHPSSLLFR